jgi:hypothetical protein
MIRKFKIGDRVYTLDNTAEIGVVTGIRFHKHHPYRVKWVGGTNEFVWSEEELIHCENGLERVLRDLPE